MVTSGWWGRWIGRTQRNVEDSENTLYHIVIIDICHYTFLQTYRVNPKVDYGLWMIIMCQCILGKICIILEIDVDNEGGCAQVGAGNVGEISVSFPQFCGKPTAALKTN